jgi:hypothetical protein
MAAKIEEALDLQQRNERNVKAWYAKLDALARHMVDNIGERRHLPDFARDMRAAGERQRYARMTQRAVLPSKRWLP